MSRWHLNTGVLMGSALWVIGCVQLTTAQVIPDNTLPVGERSQVTGNPNFQIDGGARRGGNLFHSFQSFSVPTGGSAYFNNAADVQNILTRVTGGTTSNIDGLIRANGTANLFLLNPSGIIFGAGASLNIGGSFIASTANSINFADNFQYSATNPQTTPLLTVSVPVGLQMGANPGAIVVQGKGYDLSVTVPIFSPLIRGSSPTGLRMPVGQTLALIGGDIAIDGGTLTAEQGRIELGSVRDGQVSFDGSFALSYPGAQNFGDIRLSQQALGDASGGGVIQIYGNNVSLTDGSLLLIQNQGTQAGGSIRVNAVQSLEVSGTDPQARLNGGLNSEAVGVRRGADVAVLTRQLLVQNGAAIGARSYSAAATGDVTVNAFDAVQLSSFSPLNPSLLSGLSTVAFGSGSGGTVTVSTGRLSVLEGAVLSSGNFGSGKGGTMTVNATELIEIMGQSPLLSSSNVNSTTLNVGDAGAVTVNTARLVLQNGGNISSSALGIGNAGSVTINASELVEVSGTALGYPLPSFVGASAPISSKPVRQIFRLPDRPSGNSGSVTINTPRLSISNGANVTVSNDGTGSAGTLRVNANSIFLDRGGAITAATASGEGGNIALNVRDFLLLRNNSQITTSAGGNGNGGNIRIDAGALVAVPNENSDIRANSVNARGGNITINASGIFGTQFRPQDTPLSDITATGANSAQNGSVQLNIEQPDPTSGLVELPTTVVDSSGLITQGCAANQGNSFVVTGRGGLPPTPEQQLDDDADWQDRRRITVAQQTPDPTSHTPTSTHPRHPTPRSGNNQSSDGKIDTSHPPIIEATGWQLTPTGKVILVVTTPEATVQHPFPQPVDCKGRR